MGRKSKGAGTFAKNNLASLRAEAGLTLQELSDLTSISKPHLNRLESFKARLSVDLADKLAAALKTTRSNILDIQNGTVRVMVTGHVEADEWTDGVDWPAKDQTEVIIFDRNTYKGVRRQASLVLGDSVDKIYPAGTILVWVPFDEINEPMLSGKDYIIDRFNSEGLVERTVRTFLRDIKGSWLYMDSSNTKHKQAIKFEDGKEFTVVGRVIQAHIDR